MFFNNFFHFTTLKSNAIFDLAQTGFYLSLIIIWFNNPHFMVFYKMAHNNPGALSPECN